MKKEIVCAILDDEPHAVQLLLKYAEILGNLQVIYAGTDPVECLSIVNSQDVELMFIDIQMPELTGISFMQLAKGNTNYIITSAYSEYALEGFKFNVIDYLLKPIGIEKFSNSIEKYRNWKDSFIKSNNANYIFVKSDRKHHQVEFDSIIYIEGMRDYLIIHTENDRIIVLENMKDFLLKLPKREFMRVHRSFIISIKKIKVIEGNLIRLSNGMTISIGETYRKQVNEWIDRYK